MESCDPLEKRSLFSPKGKQLIISLISTLVGFIYLFSSVVYAQSLPNALESPSGYPVVLQGETLFQIETGVASFPTSFRARVISERIEAFARDPQRHIERLAIVDNEQTQTIDIRSGNDVVLSVSPGDAEAAGTTRQVLAQQHLDAIRTAIVKFRAAYSIRRLALGAVFSLTLTIGLILLAIAINRAVAALDQKLKTWQGNRIRGLRLLGTELIHADRVTGFFLELAKLVRLLLFLFLIVGYASLVLSFFPWTKALSRQIFAYLGTAAYTLGKNLVSYIPNLFFIALIIAITSYTLRLIKFTFAEVRRGTIVIPGFFLEWAKPTYNILRFAILAFAATIIFPYLPGSGTPAFQGISIFLGILFSLGSSGAVANFVAGIILTYTRAFVIGDGEAPPGEDRVKISETTGDVIEKTLLITRINTPKNVIVTVPNSIILGSHIINYSNSARSENTPPLTLNTTITLGYDVPWRRVHEVMIEAAKATEHILIEPAPFVLQTSLDDFYVSYELNAYTGEAALMPRIYSALHQNLQDKCNDAGIEILSPHYAALRAAA